MGSGNFWLPLFFIVHVDACTKIEVGGVAAQPNPDFDWDNDTWVEILRTDYLNYDSSSFVHGDRYTFKNRQWMDEIARGALTTKRPPLPEQMTEQAADAVVRNFSCEPMLKTKWGIKKTHLYKGSNLPTSNFYYIGRWTKEDGTKQNAGNADFPRNVASRNPSKNCWRRFKVERRTLDHEWHSNGADEYPDKHEDCDDGCDEYPDFPLCLNRLEGPYKDINKNMVDDKGNDDRDDDECKSWIAKTSSSSSSSFKYHQSAEGYENEPSLGGLSPFAEFGIYGLIYDKRMEYEHKHNCKVKIEQDRFGIYTTVELRGKQASGQRPKRPEIFDYKERSIYLHCFYPTVDTALNGFTKSPQTFNYDAWTLDGQPTGRGNTVAPENERLARLWAGHDPAWRGWERSEGENITANGTDLHVYGYGHLEAKFNMQMVAGTMHDKSVLTESFGTNGIGGTAKGIGQLGDTVLVHIEADQTANPELFIYGTEAYNGAGPQGSYNPGPKDGAAYDGSINYLAREDSKVLSNTQQYRWTLNRCVLRNEERRPVLNSKEESNLEPLAVSGQEGPASFPEVADKNGDVRKITRPEENHPFNRYIELNLTRSNCFQPNFYARAFTKFAMHNTEKTEAGTAPDHSRGLTMGYEVFDLNQEFRRQCLLNLFSNHIQPTPIFPDNTWERIHCDYDDKIKLTLDCDIKICMRDPQTGDLIYPDCWTDCKPDDPNNDGFYPYKEDDPTLVDTYNTNHGLSGNDRKEEYAYPTTTDYHKWETTVYGTAQDGVVLTEEPRTYNYALRLVQTFALGGAVTYQAVWHTHPYFRVYHPNPHVDYANMGVTALAPVAVNAKWQIAKERTGENGIHLPEIPKDSDFDDAYPDDNGDDDVESSLEFLARFNPRANVLYEGDGEDVSGLSHADFNAKYIDETSCDDTTIPNDCYRMKNQPQWYGTVEPATYETVTPWKNWRDGMINYRNCSDWRHQARNCVASLGIFGDPATDCPKNPHTQTNPEHPDYPLGTYYQWAEMDEKRCRLIREFMFNGPQADTAGDNEKAAEEIRKTEWQTEQSLCDEQMVEWETSDCPGLNCCVGNCNGPHDSNGDLVEDPDDPQSKVPYCEPPCTCGITQDLDGNPVECLNKSCRCNAAGTDDGGRCPTS